MSIRSELKNSNKIVIKIGSAIVTDVTKSNSIALSRITSLAEQVYDLKKQGKQVLLVCSGAISVGNRFFDEDEILNITDFDELGNKFKISIDELQSKVSASIGQSNITATFVDLLSRWGLEPAQILVNVNDIMDKKKRYVLSRVLTKLCENSNTIPIVNTNDAVSNVKDCNVDVDGILIKDNDNLAAVLAIDIHSDLLIIFSNVDGLYTGRPSDSHSQIIRTCTREDFEKIKFENEPNSIGTGGMESKVKSALWVVDRGCAVVIANGMDTSNTILKDIISGDLIGTVFTKLTEKNISTIASLVKNSQRDLEILPFKDRADIISCLANLLDTNRDEIKKENDKDMDVERKKEKANLGRLHLTTQKINDLIKGLYQLASSKDPLDVILDQTILDDDLILKKVPVPLGVLLVVCESRPDVTPQVAALAIASGNGLMIKGGKEAIHTNIILATLIKKAMKSYKVENAFHLIDNRNDVIELLEMPQFVDLVIPRGSNQMVRTFQNLSKRIPVLGHSEGVCHIYVDSEIDIEKAKSIIIDSKCDYPSACNAVETIIFNEDLLKNNMAIFLDILKSLENNGVELFYGVKFEKYLNNLKEEQIVKDFRTEYGEKSVSLQLANDIYEAIKHINFYGSSHTDCIITERKEQADIFIKSIDSACVFWNASTRFADGYRFGLGAEVGISTNKIHARGPVGISGLLSSKYILVGKGHISSEYKDGGVKTFKHIKI